MHSSLDTLHRAVCERGATAAQYGIVVALIATAVIVVVGVFGDEFREAYEYLVKGLPGGI